MVICKIIYELNGTRHYYANMKHLMSLMPGYGDEPFLLDEIDVYLGSDRKIREVKGLLKYDPSRSGYFKKHFEGLFQGFGGHCEFMAQTAAGGAVLAGLAGSKILLVGNDYARILSPVRGKKDLICIARPVDHAECDNAFQCVVFGGEQYKKFGENARLLSRAIILGQSVA